ncbi:hypothetical protein SAMN04488503_3237 [Humidesulfovibrio mexicanus]|uniref:N-acetyltransferase domain-containing protein n=1 Tax=Humidesulfovibrio mexicanus TaxID=147047 RepID=A0A239CPW9_9BACT|nr:ABC transporter ATP-binding protein [Humidesulfovibrio mexicanus]SNS21818.1 hypothetical protein SAMN04488503_3237 [Humidesulfovibrio mexicanus]
MRLAVTHECPDFSSYRAALVKSLYNVDTGSRVSLEADLPLEDAGWKLGLIVGPSGSGKSSLGQAAWGGEAGQPAHWPNDKPIIDVIALNGDWREVTSALASVGLGSVPAWLRPYSALSTGERFRADLARIVADAPGRVVIDEFTSVVDRQIARVGAHAFSKAWRKTGGQALLLSCHYDIIPWLAPDWVFDTATWELRSGRGVQRPGIELDVFQTDWRYWPLFEPHHYLKLPHMIAATCYVGFVGETPVAHVAVSTRPGLREARACRLVVMPEWQGAGVGLRFLEAVCAMWRAGENRYGKPMPTLFHTSHPGLAAALRVRRGWTQVSGNLVGESKARCIENLRKSAVRYGYTNAGSGFGGHFRAVQGFRYLGEAEA